ncbi:MAG: GAF domain-containing protein [Chloroflexi bacterium]|nr:MAG: GAF domain-containing protein [Chloroflexota bacterium]
MQTHTYRDWNTVTLLAEQPQIHQQLVQRCPEIAGAWHKAVADPDCGADQLVELYARISELTERMVACLLAAPFDHVEALAIGAALAQLECVRPHVLSVSQKTLLPRFTRGFHSLELQAQVAQLFGYLSLGFFQHAEDMAAKPAEPAPPNDLTEAARHSTDRLENLKKMQLLELAIINKQLRQELAEHKQVEDELRRYNQGLTLVNRASKVFYSTLDLEQVLSTILEEMHNLIDVFAYSVWLIDWDTNELVCWRATETHEEVIIGWRLKPGQGVAGRVVQSGKTLVVPDTRLDPLHFKQIDRELGIELRSILSVPLRGRESVVGVVQVVDTVVNRFTDTDRILLETLAEAAGVAIENARLYEQTRQDAAKKSVLLREINHRVKNNLSAINSILRLKRSRISSNDLASYVAITDDVMNHVQGLATVHNLLAASNWSPLPISELAARVIDTSLKVLSPQAYVLVQVSPSTVWVTADQAHDLALIINELVTNTVKHAVPAGCSKLPQISVRVTVVNQSIHFEFRDNGPGFPDEVLSLAPGHYNLGFELIQHIVQNSLNGVVSIHNDNGAVTVVDFPVAISKNN